MSSVAERTVEQRQRLLGETKEQAEAWVASVSRQAVFQWLAKYEKRTEPIHRTSPCEHGNVKTHCVECKRKRANDWYAKNRAKPVVRCEHGFALTMCKICRKAYNLNMYHKRKLKQQLEASAK